MKKTLFSKKALLAAIACTTFYAATTPQVWAEEVKDEYNMDGVVVTASKIEEEPFKAPANVDVVTRAMIEANHYININEALKNVPGVTIQSYGTGGENYSSNLIYINGTSNVVFLIDGMRVNTNGIISSRFEPSTMVNMDNVERIEILKGSASTLYGSDAAGGVVNIITKKLGKAEQKTTISMMSGSFNTSQYGVMNSGRNKEDLYWLISAQKDLSGNFKDGNNNTIQKGLNSKTIDLKLGKDFDKDTAVEVNFENYNSNYERPSTGGLKTTTRLKGNKDNTRVGLSYKNRISDKAVNQLSVFKNVTDLVDDSEAKSYLWSMRMETTGFSDQLTYEYDKHTLIGGFDFYQDKVKRYVGMPSVEGKNITNQSLYLQDAWYMNDKITVTTGLRSDYHSDFGRHNTPSAVLSYQPDEKTNYYFSYKEFFVAPGISQLYYHDAYGNTGNPNLKPEEGNTVEFGIKHKFDKSLNANFNIYRRKANNMIIFANQTYENTGEESTRGWNINIDKTFNENLSTNIGYTYIYIDPTKSTLNPNRDGYLPRGQWNISTNYQKDKFDMVLNGRGIVNRDGRKSQTTADEFKTFWVWDAAFNYQIQDNAKVFLKVNNIFDKFYTDQCYNMDPNSATGWYSAPGRNIQVGIKYTL